MPTTLLRDSCLTDGEIRAFVETFDSVGDAFYFLGSSSLKDVVERVRGKPKEESQSPQLYGPAALPAVPGMPQIKLNCSKRVVVFDTETTGLKPAIICQLAYIVIENGAVVHEVDRILKLPDGVKIQRKAQEIHKISNEMCSRSGLDAEEALSEFLCLCRSVLAEAGTLVAHNSSFDSRAILETCEQWDLYCDFDNDNVFCTLKESKHFSPLVNKAGHKKAFRNDELYTFFYGQSPDFATLHNALDDVRVTALNLAAGVERGLFSVP
jgi:DNA polymerase III epsilon subunit-like protein